MDGSLQVDVIVVGAGPAGGTAAYYLGQAGQRVLVLEKEALPRYKPCGGGLSAAMLAQWFPFSFDAVVETRPQQITYAFGGWEVVQPVTDEDAMCMVRRDAFDAFLLQHAQAEVRTGAVVQKVTEAADGVTVETADGSVFRARYLIGADGANSVAAHAVRRRRSRPRFPALEAEVYAPPEVLQRFAKGPWFIVGEVGYGYLWIFPKADHLSVGIAAQNPKAGELQAKLKKVMGRYGISLEGAEMRGHLIPSYTGPARIASARILLTGDAAGLVDPFTGEGIRLAIKSGYLAAQAILDGQPRRYPWRVFWHIGLSHWLGAVIGWWFYLLQPIGFALLVPIPEITACCLDMLADRAAYLEVALRSLGSIPVFWIGSAVKAVLNLGKRKDTREA